jgi:hypothetical protein
VASIFALPTPTLAQQQIYSFEIPSQDLASALRAFARTSHQQVAFDASAVRGKRSPAIRGAYSARAGLALLLHDSGLDAQTAPSGLFIIRVPVKRATPASYSPAAFADPQG